MQRRLRLFYDSPALDKISKMNRTKDLIMHRRSIRAYDPTPLSWQDKDTILQTAMRPRTQER